MLGAARREAQELETTTRSRVQHESGGTGVEFSNLVATRSLQCWWEHTRWRHLLLITDQQRVRKLVQATVDDILVGNVEMAILKGVVQRGVQLKESLEADDP